MERYISDLHHNPGDKIHPALLKACLECYEDNLPLVIVGDLLNLVPLGLSAWTSSTEGRRTIFSITAELPKNTTLILGNHEGRLSWAKTLFPNVSIYREVVLGDDNRRKLVLHGHQLTQWRALSWVADDVTEWLTTTSLTRHWWYEFCKRRGWMPGSFPTPRALKIHLFAWAALAWYGLQKQASMIICGHSHDAMEWHPGNLPVTVIDLGVAQERVL
jgi:UDP-2,3-diacylglucosamine pyrophosphatase LpxH